jgi:hypothetical protein
VFWMMHCGLIERRRLGLLDFDQGLVGPFGCVEDGFELCGWLFVEVGVQAAGVVSVADGTSVSYWRTGRVRSSCSGIS